MKITHGERREKAVKEKSFLFGRVCTCCQSKVRKEKMWTVLVKPRNVCHPHFEQLYFCQKCAQTREAVLERIKNREIFGVD